MASPLEMDRARLGWWAIAFLLGGTLAYIVYSFVGTIVFGIFIYYGTRPVYRRLKRFIRPPTLAAAVSLLALALPALLLFAYTIAIGIQELEAFIDRRGLGSTRLEDLIEPYVDVSGIVFDPATLLSQPNTVDAIRQTVGEAASYLGIFGLAALHLFVMILIAFYLLRDDHRLAAWFRDRFSDREGIVDAYGRRVDRDFANIFFGNLLNGVFTGIIGGVTYGILSMISPAALLLPYPTLLGLLSGVASLIPVVGIKLVYVPMSVYLGYQVLGEPTLLWFPVLFVLASFLVVDVIPDLVLRPYVSGRGLHLGLVMLAYIIGPLLFGWYGIFLGPMLLVLIVHFANLVLPKLVAGTPIATDPDGGLDPPDDDPPVTDTSYSSSFVESDGEPTGPADLDSEQDVDRGG